MTVTLPISLSGTPLLETERLILRAPRRGDYAPWAAFATSDRARHIGGPLGEALAWRALCNLTGHWVHRGYGMFVYAAKDTPDAPIGMCGPWFPEGWPEQEIGWSVWSPAAEGKGIAFEAAQAALGYARTTLRWPTAVSYIHPDNARSIALARRLGATLDEAAAIPGGGPALVFRHPMTGGQA
jgi:RimJ/RimL family protein N-acetyltransferase